MPTFIAGAVALGLSFASWLHYLSLIGKEKVPERPVAHAIVHGAALVMGGVAIYQGGSLGLGLAIGAGLLSLFFFYLLTQAALPDATLSVKVGEPLPALAALRANGEAWSSAELAGTYTLLKAFRGSW